MMAHQDVVCSHTVVNCLYDYLGCDIKVTIDILFDK